MQTLDDNYLTLRLVRLKKCEAWPNPGGGFSFVLAKGGNGRYVAGSATQSLSPGDLLVLNSEVGGKVAATGDDLIFWCFSVCIDHLYPLFAVDEMSLLQSTTENLKGPKLYPASSSLAQECHRLVAMAPPQGDVVHRSQVLRIAAAVLSAEFQSARSNRAGFVRIEDHMMRVLEELSQNELLTLLVGEMAQKFSCSRRHLNRLFHQHFGCSVASLRMELRLLKALSLLRDPGVKIINVAEQCGFNHLGSLTRASRDALATRRVSGGRGLSNGESPVRDSDAGHPACSMRHSGLCPWVPKPDNGAVTEQKAAQTQKLGRSNGPARSERRERFIRELRGVSAQMTVKSNSGISSGIKLQTSS